LEEGSNVRANDAMVCQSHYRLDAICGAYLDRLVVRSPSATQPSKDGRPIADVLSEIADELKRQNQNRPL
jgi:hypothetical protein